MFEIDPLLLAVAFGGGVFGAAVGTLPSFIFCGFAVLAGVAAQASGGGSGLLDHVAFGPFLGPHIAFGGGAAATAYAARRGLLPSGRDVSLSLTGLERTDVLLVGGLFGALGALIEAGWGALGWRDWTDTIALTVVVSAVTARIAFGQSGLFGARFAKGDDTWLAWQRRPDQLIVIGLGAGLPSAWAAIRLGADGGGGLVGFGIAAASLVFLYTGAKMPVTHHIALPAAAAALAFDSLLAGAVAGVAGAFFGEAAARLLLLGGDTHIDPPAAAIAPSILLIRWLS